MRSLNLGLRKSLKLCFVETWIILGFCQYYLKNNQKRFSALIRINNRLTNPTEVFRNYASKFCLYFNNKKRSFDLLLLQWITDLYPSQIRLKNIKP